MIDHYDYDDCVCAILFCHHSPGLVTTLPIFDHGRSGEGCLHILSGLLFLLSRAQTKLHHERLVNVGMNYDCFDNELVEMSATLRCKAQ